MLFFSIRCLLAFLKFVKPICYVLKPCSKAGLHITRDQTSICDNIIMKYKFMKYEP